MNGSLSRTVQLGDTRSFEGRVTASNAFNTVQYAGVFTTINSPTFGQVSSAAQMRQLVFVGAFQVLGMRSRMVCREVAMAMMGKTTGDIVMGAVRRGVAGAMVALLAGSPLMGLAQSPQGARITTLKVSTNIVLTNVVVRDKKTGAVVKGLMGSDFTILENGKPQRLSSFDFQSVDEAAVLNEKSTVVGKASVAQLLNEGDVTDVKALQDHRLIVMFFDLSSMQPGGHRPLGAGGAGTTSTRRCSRRTWWR